MSPPPIAKAAAKVLAEEELDIPFESAAERENAVSAIRAELRATARRRSQRRTLGRALAAAAVLLVAGAGGYRALVHGDSPAGAVALTADEVRGEVYVGDGASRVPLARGSVVANGQLVTTAAGDATVAFKSGSRVHIDPSSAASATQGESTQLVVLSRGAVRASVTKMSAAERFVVRTDDAEIEAHGTEFTVARRLDPECGARTFVHLTEGRISIKSGNEEKYLGPGEDWASRCSGSSAPSHATSGAPSPSALPASTFPSPSNATSPAPSASIAPSASATLGDAASLPASGLAPDEELDHGTTTPAAAPSSSESYPEFGRRK